MFKGQKGRGAMVRVLALMVFVVGSLLYTRSRVLASSLETETVTIESFDGISVYPGTDVPIEWAVATSDDTADGYPKTITANVWPTNKYGESPEGSEDLRSFSVHSSFLKRGYHWIQISPTRDVGGKQQVVPVLLPGLVRRVSVWVWGSNYNHTLEAVFVGADGIQHRVPMGKLNFFGWKNMHAIMPAGVEQFSKKMFRPYLKLKGFLVTTNPSEDSDSFYNYFSDVTVTSVDRRYHNFDGSELIKAEKISELWGEDIHTIMGGLGPDSDPVSIAQGEAALPPIVGSDNPAYQKLQEVSLGQFDNPIAWIPFISSDFGFISLRSVVGRPVGGRALANSNDEQEVNQSEEDVKKVLGGKISFLKRGLTSVRVMAANPIDVNGVVKVVSVWVSGRNVPHKMSLLLRDWDGRVLKLHMGKLNFMGWRQLSVAIPSRVRQRGFLNTRVGLQVLGFEVDTDLVGSKGVYYFYLGDMRAWVDLSAFPVGGGSGDPVDTW